MRSLGDNLRGRAACLPQGAFPGNLQLVLVLRPCRFFQRTIADIGIKLHRDDFKMKVPVSMFCCQFCLQSACNPTDKACWVVFPCESSPLMEGQVVHVRNFSPWRFLWVSAADVLFGFVACGKAKRVAIQWGLTL